MEHVVKGKLSDLGFQIKDFTDSQEGPDENFTLFYGARIKPLFLIV